MEANQVILKCLLIFEKELVDEPEYDEPSSQIALKLNGSSEEDLNPEQLFLSKLNTKQKKKLLR